MNERDFDQAGSEAAPPIEMLAAYCEAHGWDHDRVNEDELVATVQGSWASYEVRAIWRQQDQVLQLIILPDVRVVEDKRSAIYEALSLINEQIWLGHFEHWSSSGSIIFRHALLLGQNDGLTLGQAETILETAIDECERFYPVFQFVLWGGKTPAEAISASMIETRGEA
jgi:hypothetical protein